MTSIADALFGRTQQVLLGLLFGQPDRSFYLRELVAAVGGGVNQVQRELQRLTAAGLIVREPRGRQVWFKANAESPVFRELKSLMAKTAGIADSVRAALQPFSRQIDAAFIYGPVARAEHDAASDVDVLVIGRLRPAKLAEIRPQLTERIGRSVQFVVISRNEFDSLIGERDALMTNIVKQPKIWLIGNDVNLIARDETRTRQPAMTRSAAITGDKKFHATRQGQRLPARDAA